MDTSYDGNSMEITDIAPGGDLILVVGTKPSPMAMLRVHSLILKNVSKVFNAMFDPRFSEGQAVGGDHPKEIALPEDDAIGMKVLCQVMHHRYGDIDPSLETLHVLRIAQVAYKYDCTGILEHIRSHWLNPRPHFKDHIPDNFLSLDFSDAGRLLAAAYLLDDATAFKELTRLMILHCGQSYLKFNTYEWAGVLIPNIMCKVCFPTTALRC